MVHKCALVKIIDMYVGGEVHVEPGPVGYHVSSNDHVKLLPRNSVIKNNVCKFPSILFIFIPDQADQCHHQPIKVSYFKNVINKILTINRRGTGRFVNATWAKYCRKYYIKHCSLLNCNMQPCWNTTNKSLLHSTTYSSRIFLH